jgi:hypothetical protein
MKPSKVRFQSPVQKPPRMTAPSPRTIPLHESYTNRPIRRSLRCFQCDSPHHIKWRCPEYVCPFCRKRAPEHAQKDCPVRRQGEHAPFDDGLRGYFDIDGYDDGNLTGEC